MLELIDAFREGGIANTAEKNKEKSIQTRKLPGMKPILICFYPVSDDTNFC